MNKLIVKMLVLLGFGGTVLTTEGCGANRAQKSRTSEAGGGRGGTQIATQSTTQMYAAPSAKFDPDMPILEKREIVAVVGRVTDEKGDPIIGTNISVKDVPGLGVISHLEGRYSISVSVGDSLVFSMIGMETRTIQVMESTETLDVQMKPDPGYVLSTVVSAYGAPRAKFDPDKPVPGKTVSGMVSDEKGEPVPYVNVSVVGGSAGVVTDENGQYSITADKDDRLRFSRRGMVMQTIDVAKRKRLDVTMKKDE